MADLITTKAAFPKSGGLAVANGAVSVNAGNGLHVNPTTGMVEVPVDTTAGLGYGSNGLEVEVDGSTIDFNSSGQLTALGGGGDNQLQLARVHISSVDAKDVNIGAGWHYRYLGSSVGYIVCLYTPSLLIPIHVWTNASEPMSNHIIYNGDGTIKVNGSSPSSATYYLTYAGYGSVNSDMLVALNVAPSAQKVNGIQFYSTVTATNFWFLSNAVITYSE